MSAGTPPRSSRSRRVCLAYIPRSSPFISSDGFSGAGSHAYTGQDTTPCKALMVFCHVWVLFLQTLTAPVRLTLGCWAAVAELCCGAPHGDAAAELPERAAGRAQPGRQRASWVGKRKLVHCITMPVFCRSGVTRKSSIMAARQAVLLTQGSPCSSFNNFWSCACQALPQP